MSDDRDYSTSVVFRPHKNSSHRNVFEMPGNKTELVRQSTTHEAYRLRTSSAKKPLSDRERKRKELEEYLWKTMTEKVLNDLAERTKSCYAQSNQFETTYLSTFQVIGFKPKEIGEQLDEELCSKYPLYNTNNGMSVPVNRYECDKSKQPVHKPLAHLFKKDNRFTSRLSDPSDHHAPVAPGHFAFV